MGEAAFRASTHGTHVLGPLSHHLAFSSFQCWTINWLNAEMPILSGVLRHLLSAWGSQPGHRTGILASGLWVCSGGLQPSLLWSMA